MVFAGHSSAVGVVAVQDVMQPQGEGSMFGSDTLDSQQMMRLVVAAAGAAVRTDLGRRLDSLES
jgi:hypothetical protein